MKAWITALGLVLIITTTGCSKSNNAETPSSTEASSGATLMDPMATPNEQEPTPAITRAQADQINASGNHTYDDMVKLIGSKGKLVKINEDDERTFEFSLSDQPNYYLYITFDEDGETLGKEVRKK